MPLFEGGIGSVEYEAGVTHRVDQRSRLRMAAIARSASPAIAREMTVERRVRDALRPAETRGGIHKLEGANA